MVVIPHIQIDGESVEGYKWKCEALMQLEKWDAAVAQCENAARLSGMRHHSRNFVVCLHPFDTCPGKFIYTNNRSRVCC